VERNGAVVLLVEDNAAMRALIRHLVQGVASVVYECDDGECALELYTLICPDWVLMDINLGGVDGFTATRAIRKADPAARVIIVTEHGDEWYRREAAAAGASGFVLKENLLELPALLAVPHATTETQP
jgi:CheY-like chemotaxis protein